MGMTRVNCLFFLTIETPFLSTCGETSQNQTPKKLWKADLLSTYVIVVYLIRYLKLLNSSKYFWAGRLELDLFPTLLGILGMNDLKTVPLSTSYWQYMNISSYTNRPGDRLTHGGSKAFMRTGDVSRSEVVNCFYLPLSCSRFADIMHTWIVSLLQCLHYSWHLRRHLCLLREGFAVSARQDICVWYCSLRQ